MKNIKRKSIIAVGVTALSALALGVGAIALSNVNKNTGFEDNAGFFGSYNLAAYADETATASKITVAGKEVDITSTATFTSTDGEYTLCLTVIDTEDLKGVTSQLVVGHKIGGTYYNGTAAGLTKYVYSSITFADETTLVASELSLGSSFTTPCFIVTEVTSTVADGNTPESIITYAGSQGLAMTLNGDSTAYTVSGIGECTDTEIVIPLSYEGLPVTVIAADAFEGNTAITGVTIPASVTSIGTEAFHDCTSLTGINIPASVTSIGTSAFNGCVSLTSVTIPDGVTSIGRYAFNGCTSITSVTVPATVKTFGQDIFNGCTKLTSAILEEGLSEVPRAMFISCSKLESVVIPVSATSIGYKTFDGCTSLKIVYYGGTADNWSAITINSEYNGNSVLSSSGVTFYYYSKTTPTTEGNFWHYVDGEPVVWVKETVE